MKLAGQKSTGNLQVRIISLPLPIIYQFIFLYGKLIASLLPRPSVKRRSMVTYIIQEFHLKLTFSNSRNFAELYRHRPEYLPKPKVNFESDELIVSQTDFGSAFGQAFNPLQLHNFSEKHHCGYLPILGSMSNFG